MSTRRARGGLRAAAARSDPQGALVLARQAMGGQLDVASEGADAWALLADMADQGAADMEDFQLVAWLRQQCYGRAELEESERWLLRAEQVWHFHNDQRKVERRQELDELTSIVIGEDKRPLWQWGSDLPDWPAFCVDTLQMKVESARMLERVYDLYVVRLNWQPERVMAAGRSKLSLALATMERNYADGRMDEDLLSLLDEGTFYEVREHIAGMRNQVATTMRQPLSTDADTGKVTFWADDGVALEFGVVKLNDPPSDLSDRDMGIWHRRQQVILSTVGLA